MTTASLKPSFVSAVTLLGGEGVLRAKPRVVMDWIPLVRRGLPSASIDAVVRLTWGETGDKNDLSDGE